MSKSDYLDNNFTLQGCGNADVHLWMAVMDRAVRDLEALERHKKNPSVVDDPLFRSDYRSLRNWFASDSMDTGSFNWICSLVNMDSRWAINRIQTRLNITSLGSSNPLVPPGKAKKRVKAAA